LEIRCFGSAKDPVIEGNSLSDELGSDTSERFGAVAISKQEDAVVTFWIHPRESIVQGQSRPGHFTTSRKNGGFPFARRNDLGREVEKVETVVLIRAGPLQQRAPLLFTRIDERSCRMRTVHQNPKIDSTALQDNPRIAKKKRDEEKKGEAERSPKLERAEDPPREEEKREQKQELGGTKGHAVFGRREKFRRASHVATVPRLEEDRRFVKRN